jgi:hypothetical protein
VTAGFVRIRPIPSGRTTPARTIGAAYAGADTTDGDYVLAYAVSKAMLQVPKQCEGNFGVITIWDRKTRTKNLRSNQVPLLAAEGQ